MLRGAGAALCGDRVATACEEGHQGEQEATLCLVPEPQEGLL